LQEYSPREDRAPTKSARTYRYGRSRRIRGSYSTLLAASEGRLLTEVIDVAVHCAPFDLAVRSREGVVSDRTEVRDLWPFVLHDDPFLRPYWTPVGVWANATQRTRQRPYQLDVSFLRLSA
jgi:hypothetical protein